MNPTAPGSSIGAPQGLLFRQYPGLMQSIPHVDLGVFPTPVQRLEHLQHPSLWIKREDLSSPLYGGNKVRKLEFILADAMRKGRDKIVTMGGIRTNHGLATAIFCQQLGLTAKLCLFPQPVTHYVQHNLLLFQKFGAELATYKTMIGAGLALKTSQRLRNPRAYFLHAGGSSPMGTVGIVTAMFELEAQVAAGLLPEPDIIFCPLGSSGMVAGLALGGALAGLKSRVVGVRITYDHFGPIQIANQLTVKALMCQTLALLRKNAPDLPDLKLPEPDIVDAYLGAGYGAPTAACRDAMARMKEIEGICLDPTYTAKTFAAVLDYIRQPASACKHILYWHTYNSADHSALAASVDYHALPQALHYAFENPGVEV